MATSVFSRIKLILFCIISSLFLSTNSEPTQITEIFYNVGTYNFEQDKVPANISKVMTRLKIEASSNTYYFRSNSTGVGLNKFIAFYSCRYDVSPRACQSCVADGVEAIYSRLPSIKSFLMYEECIVGHSNSSNPDLDLNAIGLFSRRDHPIKEDEGRFLQVLHNTIFELISDVIIEFDKSSRYFALTTANYSSHETMYALAQCNPDITSSSCTRCLQDCFGDVESEPAGAIYGQFFRPFCRLSYLFSTEELSRPWNFKLTYEEIHPPASTGTRGSSIIGAMIATISSLALTLKLLQ